MNYCGECNVYTSDDTCRECGEDTDTRCLVCNEALRDCECEEIMY